MGAVSKALTWLGDTIGDGLRAVGNLAGDTLKAIGNGIQKLGDFAGDTIKAIIKDPLPTLLSYAGTLIGIPPYVTSAVITAAKGGNFEDIAKSAAISYASTEFMSNTQIGADIKNYTVNQWSGDFTDSMMEKFNLSADQAVQISKIASASLNSSLVGGINAVLTGKPVVEGLTSGFTSGLVYSSTDSYFDSINKDPSWGFSQKALNVMKGATSTALNTVISGKGDPAQALGNYIAYATLNMGTSELFKTAKDTYKLLTTDTDAAKLAQDKYTTEKAEYDSQIKKGEELRVGINADVAAYQKTIDDQYNPFKKSYDDLVASNDDQAKVFNEQKKAFEDNKWSYENYDTKLKQDGWESMPDGEGGSSYVKRTGGHYEERSEDGYTYKIYVPDSAYWSGDDYVSSIKTDYNAPSQQSFAEAANAAATKANAAADKSKEIQAAATKLYEENKPMLDGLGESKIAIDKKVADLNVIKKDVEDPSVAGSTAAKLKAASEAYQTKYEAWAKTKDAADRSAENYTKALAAVATRDATIDALNSGAISVTSKDADGNWILSNGMTLTSQGKFMQDGQQVFTNAAGIPQKVMDFTAADGSKVDFDDNAGRVLSTSDVQNICKRDYGFTPTATEAEKIAGGVYTTDATNPIKTLADQKAKDAYSYITGNQPTDSELATIRKSGDVVTTAQDAAINGLDLPSDYKFPDQDTKVGYGKAYAAFRNAFGNNYIFEWTNPKTGITGKFTTESDDEKTARINKMMANSQSRINMMPVSALTGTGRGFLNVNDGQQIVNMMAGSNVVGSGRGFVSELDTQALINMMPSNSGSGSGRGIFGGNPTDIQNIYYGKKDGNVYVDTRTYDALGNVTGGSLNLADDRTATAVRATNWIEQAQATGAQGAGELLQNLANAVALYTGSNMNNSVYNVGKAVEQWGKDRDGADILKQDANMESVMRVASLYSNPMDQLRILANGVKENPLSFMSSVGKEVVQEGPGWIAASIAGAFMAPMAVGVGTALTVKAAISAGLDALESMGSGGREVYDSLIKQGYSESSAREKAMINGGWHALMTAPAEYVADRLLFGHFVKGLEGGVLSYSARFGANVATNALSETLEALPQNLSTQYLTTGKFDIKSATAGALFEGMIGSGTVATIMGGHSINEAAIVAKDYDGNNVTLKEFMDGTKNVDLKTLDSSVKIGDSNNGGEVTLGALTAVAENIGIPSTDIKTFLPSSVTDYSSVVYRSLDGTAVTLGNIDSILKKNPTLDFSTVLNNVYATPSTDFKVVFSPSVLNGTSTLKSVVDYGKIATDAGFPTYADYQQYGGDISAYNNARNSNLATAAGFPDYGTYTQYGGDLTAYTTAKTNESNTQKAKTAGFPDYASYTNFNGDKAAYDASKVVATTTGGAATGSTTGAATGAATGAVTGNVTGATTSAATGSTTGLTTAEANAKLATDAGFPDFASYTQYGGNISAYNTAQTDALNLTKAKTAGFPDYASYTKYKGDVGVYNSDLTTAANVKKATDAGFPDFATYTQYGGDKNAYSTALTNTANTQKATAAGFPSYADYTQYGGDIKAYNSALTTAANAKKATDAGFPNYESYTQYGGDVSAYKADSAAKIAGWKDAAEQTKASTAGYTDPSTYATYLTNTANTQKATTAGFPDYGTYTQFNGDLAAYNSSKLTAATTTAINNAIAGIQFPAGITAADVAAQVKAALDANPNLKAADVTKAITDYMTANPGVTADDVTKAVNTATKNLVTSDAMTTALAGVSDDVKTKFDALTQGQKDIVTAYTQQGVDINKAINDASKLTTEQVAGVKTQLATLTGDVKTKFDTLTQGQKDIVNAQVQQGVDLNKAIEDAAKTTTEQITKVNTDLTKNITNVQTQFNTRVDELMKQGQDYQTATNTALKELGTGISGLQTDVLSLTEEQKKAALDAKRAANTSNTSKNLSSAMSMIAPALGAGAAGLIDNSTPGFKDIGYKTTGEAKFESVLSPFQQMVEENSYAAKPQQQNEQQTQQQLQQAAPVNQDLDPQKNQQQGSDYFSYGSSNEIDQLLGSNPGTQMLYKAGGLATPLFAGGGTTRHGRYAGGGLNVVEHSGKARLDFRTGNAVTGPGDGQSDDIPAMLADGEFVFPADVVAALGNGSTKAGSDKLYDMMHSIRAYHRSAKPKDLPPPAKQSPLDYLTKTARKARR